MNRNQIFTTLEFIDDNIRMVLGEYYNEKFYIYDVFESPCKGLVEGEIVDKDLVIACVKQIRDAINLKHDILIEEVTLSMPSNKLSILAFTSTSPVTGKNSLISEYDIKEAYRIACKVRHDEDKTIVSVIPVEYYLDSGEKMEIAPLRYKANQFRTLFNVLLLPSSLYNTYLEIASSSNLRVTNCFASSECMYAGVVEEGDINCAIISLNKYSSSISVYKRGKLLSQYNYEKGSSILENMITNKYHVKSEDINRVCYVLANGYLPSSNKRSVYKNDNYESYKYLSQYMIDEIVNEIYSDIFNNIIANLNSDFNSNSYDVYLIGKGSSIRNLDKLYTSISGINSLIVNPSHLCLNNPSYVSTIGLIKLNYKKLLENKNVIANTKELVETNDSKFDKFILDENELN